MKCIFSAVFLTLVWEAQGAVVINEFMAASSDRRLAWSSNDVAQIGSGTAWTDPSFSDQSWGTAVLPAGYGFGGGIGTDLSGMMKDQALSFYLRREFQVTPEQASATQLNLSITINDGYVAYLNGHEVARTNCGPVNHFMYASQPAYNECPSFIGVVNDLGSASNWLVPGRNVIAVQAHNAEEASTAENAELITQHIPTTNFMINCALWEGSASSPVLLVPGGVAGGPWRAFVGRYEPSGGVVDEGLITNHFAPPQGEEDDYDQPDAFVDWVELYNDAAVPANIGGWCLSDDSGHAGKWHFPTNTILGPHGFLLVLCDDRDEANAPAGPAQRLHANFKLGREGEFLALSDAATNFVDGFPAGFPPQNFCRSYGRNPSDPSTFVYFESASPGQTNFGSFFPAQVAVPQFKDNANTDLPGGIYPGSSLTLQLLPATPGSAIRYTLDGSEPTAWNGILYAGPLTITQATDKIGTVVRARAFLAGWLPSDVATHSYLLRQPSALTNSPTMLLTADAGRDFYAPRGILAIVGGTYVSTSSGSIWVATSLGDYDQPLGDGFPFERAVHLEYYFPSSYYPSNQPPVRDDLGLRYSGSDYQRPRMTLQNTGASPWQPSDSFEKPSFNIHFNSDYGSSPITYPFFTNYPVRDFKHLRLRAGKNDNINPFITDELVRRLWIDMGHVGARGLFCSLYLNAVYKGVFNLTERFREPFFQAHYNSSANWDVDYSWSWVDGDSTAFYQLLATLDTDLSQAANWAAVTNQMDIDNVADYYLLNIYCAMWDWPGNNFVIARERSTGPDGRFRFAVWDAEGAFNVNSYYGHPPSYDTTYNDLLSVTDDWNYLPRIFRRLSGSAEFRLRFADRVNLRLFNAGVLDDRDPDGAGPLRSRFGQRLVELVAEAGPLVQYNSGGSLNTGPFDIWLNSGSGRRSYLLGTATGRRMLRDRGFWPVTEPPVFSQYGGSVLLGYQLSITSSVATAGQTAAIYYTTNGADPRLIGGALNAGALLYTNPVTINQILSVKARARNNTTAEWSPLTEATFLVAVQPASSNNLVVAEMMYHPQHATAAELAAGFSNADDFEFLRLLNISTNSIDLAGVQFTVGITFSFSTASIRYLPPGGQVLVVKSRAAFQTRYGHNYDALIAGEYSGNLSNGGERLQLLAGDGSVLRDFTYGDAAPWPEAADGGGPSLILRSPGGNPDPALPANWIASAIPGGLPGGTAPAQTYSGWRSLYWDSTSATNDLVSGPSADPDGDGLNNLSEYIYGFSPAQSNAAPTLLPTLEMTNSESHLTVTLRTSAGASDVTLMPQTSSDLLNWTNSLGSFPLLQAIAGEEGILTSRYRDLTTSTNRQRFVRFQFTATLH